MILWLAQGFGSGRIPFAPGTFGSIVGLAWTALLLASGSWIVFTCGIIGGFAISVWTCGEGEKILNQKDPGSIVMDEIAAIPLCFVGWLAMSFSVLPSPEMIFVHYWPVPIIIFILFRFFDILKPWPVRQSQSLPGGWGVTVDDTLAAIYVNFSSCVLLWCFAKRL